MSIPYESLFQHPVRVDDDIETVLQAIVERRSVAIAASRLMKSGSSSSSVSQKFSMVST